MARGVIHHFFVHGFHFRRVTAHKLFEQKTRDVMDLIHHLAVIYA
ncbi:Uncharacterised protein [Vibrio cholerae]|nr:Uncharacterised protein [Vibrio cholerae]